MFGMIQMETSWGSLNHKTGVGKVNKLTLLIASDSNHDKVFAEIYDNKKFLAVVSQDEGMDDLKIEFPGLTVDEMLVTRDVRMDSFIEALSEARKRLLKA